MKTTRQQVKKNLATFYDQSSREYHHWNYLAIKDYSPLRYRQHYIQKMIQNQHVPRGARILDVGSGPGELVLWLLREGYSVWGVDISAGMVEEARKTIQEGGFSCIQQISVGDIENLDFGDEFFDVVVAAGVLEYQKEDGRALSEMRRVLKKGGYLILNVTNRYSYVTLSENVYLWLKRKLITRAMLNFAKGQILHMGQVTDFPERRTHSPRQFDKEVVGLGFKKVAYNYFRFSPLPVPFDSIFGFVCGPIGRYMEGLTNSPVGLAGGGYLVLFMKAEDLPTARRCGGGEAD